MSLFQPPPPMKPLTPPPVREPPIGPGEVCYVRVRLIKQCDEPFDGRKSVWLAEPIDEAGNEIEIEHRLFLDPREIVRLAKMRELLCRQP